MKRKELAKYIDQMSDCIDGLEIEPDIKVKDRALEKRLSKARLTQEEITCVKAGAIAALVEVHRLLTDEREPDKPYTHAIEMMVETIGLLIDRRAMEVLKGDDAND